MMTMATMVTKTIMMTILIMMTIMTLRAIAVMMTLVTMMTILTMMNILAMITILTMMRFAASISLVCKFDRFENSFWRQSITHIMNKKTAQTFFEPEQVQMAQIILYQMIYTPFEIACN